MYRVLSAALIVMTLTLAQSAAAQTTDEKLVLTAGGRTIAGPGTFAGDAGAKRDVVFFSQIGVTRNMCATVANVGSSVMSVHLLGNSKNLIFQISPAPGETLTNCATGASYVRLLCNGGAPCKAVWRADLM
jgi:hypothetical protein